MGVPTATVAPASARSRRSTPVAGAGTSTSTLSVVTSAMDSPSVTASPSTLRHSTMVPSVTDSPMAGRVTLIVSGTGALDWVTGDCGGATAGCAGGRADGPGSHLPDTSYGGTSVSTRRSPRPARTVS